MTDARSIPAAVQWHEGMLLSPQHFQQNELRAQALQSYLMLAAAPYHWGVKQLEIDPNALQVGTFALTRLEAIMPDGLLVAYPSDADRMAAGPVIDVLSSLDKDGTRPGSNAGASEEVRSRRVVVHLIVAVRRLPFSHPAEPRRFRQVEGPDVTDEVTGDNSVSIPRLVPRLDLHLTDDPLGSPPAQFTSLPLAVLEIAGRRCTMIDYEPPRFRIDHAPLLFKCASSVAAALRGKATEWQVRPGSGTSHGEANIIADSIATLRTIARGLPRLEALLNNGAVHPFDLYLALCDISGDVAVVGGHVTLPPLEPYRHENALAAFNSVANVIHDALKMLRTPYTSVEFERTRPGCFEIAASAERLRGGHLVIGARLPPGQDAAAVRAWFFAAVIGGVPRIDAMLNNAVIGARREAISEAPELDLVPGPDMLLFRVAADPDLVMEGERLRISHPPVLGQAEPSELRLFLSSPHDGDA